MIISGYLFKLIYSNQTNESPVNNLGKKIEPKKKFSIKRLPWWFKIIAYILSVSISIVSVVFIIVKGIEFGDETVQKWLVSFIISVLTSFLLTQPFQV